MKPGKMNCTHSGLLKTEGMRDWLTEIKIFQFVSLLDLSDIVFIVLLFSFVISTNYGFFLSLHIHP